jgi:hypothetical protein
MCPTVSMIGVVPVAGIEPATFGLQSWPDRLHGWQGLANYQIKSGSCPEE